MAELRSAGRLTIMRGMFGCALILVLLVLASCQSVNERAAEVPRTTPQQEIEQLRAALDPVPAKPLTPREHLRKARELLARVDSADEKSAWQLIQLSAEHAKEAKRDARLNRESEALLNRAASAGIRLGLLKVWESRRAQLNAEMMCRTEVERRLKAPATATWAAPDLRQWTDHPGYFVVFQTVDAQNSFGAMLRGTFRCKVLCMTEDGCALKEVVEER